MPIVFEWKLTPGNYAEATCGHSRLVAPSLY
jgi:hypothetical protein